MHRGRSRPRASPGKAHHPLPQLQTLKEPALRLRVALVTVGVTEPTPTLPTGRGRRTKRPGSLPPAPSASPVSLSGVLLSNAREGFTYPEPSLSRGHALKVPAGPDGSLHLYRAAWSVALGALRVSQEVLASWTHLLTSIHSADWEPPRCRHNLEVSASSWHAAQTMGMGWAGTVPWGRGCSWLDPGH